MGKTLDELWDRAVELGRREGGTILHRTTKLTEETGELSAAVLLKDGYKLNKKNLTPEEIDANIIDESGDSMLVLIDLIDRAGFTKADLINSLEKGIKNWENVIDTHENT